MGVQIIKKKETTAFFYHWFFQNNFFIKHQRRLPPGNNSYEEIFTSFRLTFYNRESLYHRSRKENYRKVSNPIDAKR